MGCPRLRPPHVGCRFYPQQRLYFRRLMATGSLFPGFGMLVQLAVYIHKVFYTLGLINYVDTKSKCRHLQNITCKGTLLQVLIYLSSSPPYTLYKYMYLFTQRREGEGRVEPERWWEGQQITKLGWKYYYDWMYARDWLCPVYKYDKHLPQSPFTGQFFRRQHFTLPSVSLIFLYLLQRLLVATARRGLVQPTPPTPRSPASAPPLCRSSRRTSAMSGASS
jgi:hypothetical protein